MLDGETFQPWIQDDLPALVDICNSSYRADGVEQVLTVERLRSTYDNIDPTHSDLSTDMLMVEVDGRPVGYGRVEWGDEPDGPRVYSCIGEIRATHPQGPKLLEGWAWDSAESRVELLE